ncbi:MAG TPA: hypothetical protein GX690_02990 [Tenericutes bacterium]|jgi:pro-sigmaK processing inhibitor BofA|nr:hypothetical protein [Mycoplasmatota bacterium]
MWKIIRKVVLGGFMLYLYNLVAVHFNLLISINLITLLISAVLGFPGILAMAGALLLNF